MAIWHHKSRWYVKVMHQGILYRGEMGYTTKDQAIEELAKIKSGIRLAGLNGSLGQAPLFRDAWVLYLQHSEAYNGRAWYQAKVYIGNRYFKKWFDLKITDITPQNIEDHMVERRNKSARSANLDFEILRNFFTWCVQREFMDKSPCRFIRKFSHKAVLRILPTQKDIETLIANNEGQDKLLILLLVNTLGRISEIMELKWTDIDLDKRVLHLKTRKTKDGSEKIREIPINGLLLECLISREPKDGYVLKSNVENQPYRDLRRKLKKCVERAGVYSICGFHQFRHYGISKLMEQGVDPATIRDLAGHSSLTMTGHYSHSSIEAKRSAMEILS